MLQALHGGDEGDPPALALRRVVGARAAMLEWTSERERELEEDFAQRYDGDARTSLAGTRAGRGRARARRSSRELGLDPEPQDRRRLLARALGREHVLRARPLRRPGGVVRRDRARGRARTTRVNWIVKLHPANVWKRKRDGVERRARRARRDPRARRRAAAARQAARARRPTSSTWSLFDVDRLGRDDPRLGRLRAPVLRRARADRRHRLLLGPRVHGRLRDRRRVPRAGSRGSRTLAPPDATSGRARASGTRTRSSGCARRGSRASARVYKPLERDRRPVRGDDRASACAHAGGAGAAETYDRSASGPSRSRELDYLEL